MELKTFSCYDNFLLCNHIGAPQDFEPSHAMDHLKHLIENSLKELKNIPYSCEASSTECSKSESNWENITLMAFSKGCVVLNKLLHELHHYKSNPDEEKSKDMLEFWSKVKV